MGASSLEKVKRIPIGLSPEDRISRLELYKQLDMNNNGYLSLAEIDKGIRDVLDLPELFDAKPVLIRAYEVSKNKCKGTKTYSDDYVSKAEFRYLLIGLKLYYHLWIEFEAFDKTGDRRISETEFLAGQDIIHQWGIKVKDPKATFEALLKKYNAQANITFT
jgi:hypothetical protein